MFIYSNSTTPALLRFALLAAVGFNDDASFVGQSVPSGPHGERDGARRGRDRERRALPERRQRPASQIHQRLGAGAADHHVGRAPKNLCTREMVEGETKKGGGGAEGEVNIFA